MVRVKDTYEGGAMVEQTAGMNRVTRWLATLGAVGLSDRELLTRFAINGDQIAFEALVSRHSRMVIGACRRLLPCAQDAEDACQAVFLLLAKKAGQAKWNASVAGWLYTTARKVAHNARVAADRRIRRESRAAVPVAVTPVDGLSARELVQMLDQELDRIGPRYREPLVLCCLEGLTQDEAAARLGVPRQTLKSQLKRARKKLAAALAARGCDLGVVLLVVAAGSAQACDRTLRGAIMTAATGVPSATVAALARGITMNAAFLYAKATLVAIALAAAAVGIALAANQPVAAPSAENPAEKTSAPVEQPMLARIGTNRFRADYPIDDARFSPDGKSIVGCAGGNLFVWNSSDGQLVRRIDTGLGFLDNPSAHMGKTFAFAINPKKNEVACGGSKDGHTVLQVWDFETGKKIAEATSSCEALKALAWTLEGGLLLERADDAWNHPSSFKLIVLDGKLKERNAFDLPAGLISYSSVMQPLPGGKQVLLWHGRSEPMIFDIEFGKERGGIAHKQGIPSGLALSPDARMLAATSTEDIRLLQFPSGEIHKVLPVHRPSWDKPRPLFSPDGKTVYVWDHRPIAYDVETGQEKWKASSRTIHTVRMDMCDVSPDGASLLIRHGHALALFDARTGAERNMADAPSLPSRIVWSPDGAKIFTRVERHDRTWTAWNAATGARLYDLQPTGFVEDDDWKMLPDMFFITGGREIVVGLEKKESTEGIGPKELLVFDLSTGRPLRRLGMPLPNNLFQWMYPIAVDPAGKTVLMQMFAISAPAGAPGTPVQFELNADYSYKNILWDPVAQASLKEWLVHGERTDSPGHFAPYYITIRETLPSMQPADLNQKGAPAKIRCYSLDRGKLVHELESDSIQVAADRISDDMLLVLGNNGQWVQNANTTRFVREHPFYCDLWDILAEEKVRVDELPQTTEVALGPQGRYVVTVLGDGSFEIFEPFVLKKAVAEIATPSRAKQFEFSQDGKRLAVSMRDTNIAIWDTTDWQKTIEEQIAREVPSDLTPLWADLAKDAATGQRAARLLGAAGDKAVPFLAEKIKSAKHSKEVERRAIRALRWLNTAAARAQLEKWATGDPDATLTKSAAEALGK